MLVNKIGGDVEVLSVVNLTLIKKKINNTFFFFLLILRNFFNKVSLRLKSRKNEFILYWPSDILSNKASGSPNFFNKTFNINLSASF